MPVGDKPAAQHKAAVRVPGVPLPGKGLLSMPSLRAPRPALQVKQPLHCRTHPSHPRPHHLYLICNVPLPLSIHLQTARTDIRITLQRRDNQQRSFVLLFQLTVRLFLISMPGQSHPIGLSFTDKHVDIVLWLQLVKEVLFFVICIICGRTAEFPLKVSLSLADTYQSFLNTKEQTVNPV